MGVIKVFHDEQLQNVKSTTITLGVIQWVTSSYFFNDICSRMCQLSLRDFDYE